MHKGHGYRYVRPYNGSRNWTGDSKLAMAWFASVSFEHIHRSVVSGPDYTKTAVWESDTDIFSWQWAFFSDVGQPFKAVLDFTPISHQPLNRIRFGLIDSGDNAAIWTIPSNFAELDWGLGNILKGPWSFQGDPTVYTSPFLILKLAPVRYSQEPLKKV